VAFGNVKFYTSFAEFPIETYVNGFHKVELIYKISLVLKLVRLLSYVVKVGITSPKVIFGNGSPYVMFGSA
jgi:hypothetical protein